MSYVSIVNRSAFRLVRVRRFLDRRAWSPFCCAWLLGTPESSCASLLARLHACTLLLPPRAQGSRFKAQSSWIRDLSSPNAKRPRATLVLSISIHNSDESIFFAPALTRCSQVSLQAASRHLFNILQSERGLTDGLTTLFRRPTVHLGAFLGVSALLMLLEWSAIHNFWLYMLQRNFAHCFRIMRRNEPGSSRHKKAFLVFFAARGRSMLRRGYSSVLAQADRKRTGGAEVVARTSLLAWSFDGRVGHVSGPCFLLNEKRGEI